MSTSTASPAPSTVSGSAWLPVASRLVLQYQSALPHCPLLSGHQLEAGGGGAAGADAGIVAVQVLEQAGLDVLGLPDVDPLVGREDPVDAGGRRSVLSHRRGIVEKAPDISPRHGGSSDSVRRGLETEDGRGRSAPIGLGAHLDASRSASG